MREVKKKDETADNKVRRTRVQVTEDEDWEVKEEDKETIGDDAEVKEKRGCENGR